MGRTTGGGDFRSTEICVSLGESKRKKESKREIERERERERE